MNLKKRWNSYIIINLIFAGIIVSIIVYALVFSAQGRKHPVPSGSVWFTEHTQSTGLSRSFSEIVRLNFEKAKQYNPYGIRIFLFFAVQLMLRILLSILVFRPLSGWRGNVILFDVILTITLFVVCFWPFLVTLISEFAHIFHPT